MRHPFRVAVLGGLALLLSACAGGPPQAPGDRGDGSPDRSKAAPGGGSSGRPAASALEELKGLSKADVERRFGSPAFRRSEAPAEIWQYRTRVCSLDLFLYRQPNKSVTVSYAAVRGPSGSPVGEADCLGAVQSARAGEN